MNKKYKVTQLKYNINDVRKMDFSALEKSIKLKCAKIMRISPEDIEYLEIEKRSLDARKKPELFYSYSVILHIKNEISVKLSSDKVSIYNKTSFSLKKISSPEVGNTEVRPVIVGFGPAGIACAYSLALMGLKPIVIEQGSEVEKRKNAVEKFWKSGLLDEKTNVQFGEGGAGAFSDGKLNTGNKDKDGIQKAILKTLVKFGANEAVLYDAKPHIGTDKLCNIVKNIRKEIIELGGDVYFDTKLVKVIKENDTVCAIEILKGNEQKTIECNNLVLALGNCSRDTYKMLNDEGIAIAPKPFAVGYRLAHKQSFIDMRQFGSKSRDLGIGAADYKLTTTLKNKRAVFSFCMCPGGYIVNASSERDGLCINGMSYSDRGGEYANSAIVMSITPQELNGDDALRCMYYQESLERKAYLAGNGKIPYCTLADSYDIKPNAFKGEAVYVSNLLRDNLVLNEKLNKDFIYSMKDFAKKIPGFDNEDTIVAAIETRTSAPIRILRDENNMSINIKGLYPCGEGAGYAGGIISAAVDGVRTAMSILHP